jgi:hypothetical protein
MLDDVKIMQFADGTLDPSEREIVQKEIENNPKYKKLLKDYTYTGEILSNISREIKSKPLPKYLENKVIEFNKNSIKTLSKNKLTFNFFNILNIKYSAIAAVFCITFMSGYFTNQILVDTNSKHQISIKFSEPSKDFRSSNTNNIFIDFYATFNEKKFNEEINLIANKLKKDQKFEISISEGQKFKFQYIEDFKNKKNNNCKIIKSDKKVKLTSNGLENEISLTICQNNNYWTLTNINIL